MNVSQIVSGDLQLGLTRKQPNPPSDGSNARQQLTELYNPVSDHLAAVESILKTELSSDTPFVDELLEHSWLLGGKRMRPVLLLLSGLSFVNSETTDDRQSAAANQPQSTHERLHLMAAAVEMIHTATLVHDDILDKADLRRHKPTANAKWGDRVSVLLGDYLFTHAFHVASKSGSADGLGKLAAASNLVCAGEMKQNFHAGNFEIEEGLYFEIISEKTAELCAAACGIGAIIVGAGQNQVEAFEKYGRDLGIAFQIIDDVLDLVGSQTDVGKTLGTDLFNSKPTLPIIHCLQNLDKGRRDELLKLLHAGQDVRAVSALLCSTGSIKAARAVAQKHAAQAEAFAKQLAPNEASQALVKIAQFVLARSY